MTNFRIKCTSCVSKIARETDLEIKIANRYTEIFAQGDANKVRTIVRITTVRTTKNN